MRCVRETAFVLENDLRSPIREWLRSEGFECADELVVGDRRADVVGFREDSVVAVELKLTDWRTALRQAMAYQVAADRAWVAMPLAHASRAFCHRGRFEAEGVGLLAVDDRGGPRQAIPAGPSPRVLPFATEGLRVAAGRLFSNRETALEAL